MLFWLILLLLLSILALYKGADLLVHHASALAVKLGLSTLIIGISVVTLGGLLPELSVAITSSLAGANDLVVGNALGTLIFNIGVVLALAAIIHPIIIQGGVLRHEFPWLMLSAVVIYALSFDLTISRLDALVLIIMAVAFMAYSIRQSREEHWEKVGECHQQRLAASTVSRKEHYFKLTLGLLLVALGAKLFVDSGLKMAEVLHFSQLLVGILIIAIGTSLPELATVTLASAHHQPLLGLGNVIGANTLNVFLVIGVAALIHPLRIHPDLLIFDFPMVIFFTIIVFYLFKSSHRLTRLEGAFLLLGYIVYFVYSIKFWG